MKRPWFQFHLSTAIVMMFVASGLLWLNSIPNFGSSPPGLDFEAPAAGIERVCYGWPYWWLVLEVEQNSMKTVSTDWLRSGAAIDLLVALTVLGIVALACEWRIRRGTRTTDNGQLTKDK